MRMLIPLVLLAVVVYNEACFSIKIGHGKGHDHSNKGAGCPAEGECPCDALPLQDEFAVYVVVDGEPQGEAPEAPAEEPTEVAARKKRSGNKKGKGKKGHNCKHGGKHGSCEETGFHDHGTEAVIDVAGILEYYGFAETEETIVCVAETDDGDKDLTFDISSPPEVTLICTDGYWDGAVTIGEDTIDLTSVTALECGTADAEGEDEEAAGEEEEEEEEAAGEEEEEEAAGEEEEEAGGESEESEESAGGESEEPEETAGGESEESAGGESEESEDAVEETTASATTDEA